MLELSLRFPDPAHVVISLNQSGEIEDAVRQPFTGPLDAVAQQDLHWYLEVYPAHYMTEIDDDRAARIAARLPEWGAALFERVFAAHNAEKLFNRFQANAVAGRLLTVSAAHPRVLAQPWELLCDPKGTYLFLNEPRISIRRCLSGADGGSPPFEVQAKDQLHLLFVVSRPSDASFIDPRSDPKAVMDSLDERAPGRVTVEFLRPATLDTLRKRLDDKDSPAVDILHFDGHGAYRAKGAMQHGFLLFETAEGKAHLVSAKELGGILKKKRIGLVVFSACQSAMVGGEDAMGSVAARLIHSGLPAVVAMTHSVLAATTRALFDELYDELAKGRPIGTALDNARGALYANPGRGQRRRGEGFITLALQDWFLPALYQAGHDTALLTKSASVATVAHFAATGLEPLQESGFWGRRRELWDIERWFVGGTRRLVVHGFGGEGKTYLASEIGRWLVRTGMFARVCSIDYKAFQGVDAVGYAISTLGSILGISLIDAAAATAALAATPTLLILDNLEAVQADAATELLGAARTWSEAGASRLLVTTRQPDLDDPDWPTLGSNRCRYLSLKGLQPEDARDWFQELMKLPPEPNVAHPNSGALDALFGKVYFHPLSIGALASALRSQEIAEVEERLTGILKDQKNSIVASLSPSLEQLDPRHSASLAMLGVFRGGAWERLVTLVTGIGEEDWSALRRELDQWGLVRAEAIPRAGSFLIFHPALTPTQWDLLSAGERERLTRQYCEVYYRLSQFLYSSDAKNIQPTRAIACRELPNLMTAVSIYLRNGCPEAVDFADNIVRFLEVFGLWGDRAMLVQHMQEMAGEKGSSTWIMARFRLARECENSNRLEDAEDCYIDILENSGSYPSFVRCKSLGRFAHFLSRLGRIGKAEHLFRQAIDEISALDQVPHVRRLTAALYDDLGEVLRSCGNLNSARIAIQRALDIHLEVADEVGIIRSAGQFGAVYLVEGSLHDAGRFFRLGLDASLSVQLPDMAATSWHHLGLVFQDQEQWDEAERAFREAARIREARSDIDSAAASWCHIAQVMAAQGRRKDVERWYAKALSVYRTNLDRLAEAEVLYNLAAFLASDRRRLTDARRYGEEALAIKEDLDTTASDFWKTVFLLARIAEQEGHSEAARAYRRRARQTFANSPASVMWVARTATCIPAVVMATTASALQPTVMNLFERLGAVGGEKLFHAIQEILTGERNPEVLCEYLDPISTVIVSTILRALVDSKYYASLVGPLFSQEDAAPSFRSILQQHTKLVRLIVAVTSDLTMRPQIEPTLTQLQDKGWVRLVDAVNLVLDGERDGNTLCRGLDGEDTLIIRTVLAAIASSDFLGALPDNPSAKSGQ